MTATGFIRIPTNDKIIRIGLEKNLKEYYSEYPLRIIPEFGVRHGSARIDIAVINGLIHGYEIKSDRDTLQRLPRQMPIYNSVFDQVTLVVGKNHLYEAVKIVPDWWGIQIAKILNPDNAVSFSNIREAEANPDQDNVAIARLLWREEALGILEEIGQADGVRSKPRSAVYERLVEVLDSHVLKTKVREHLCSRINWRSDAQLVPNGG